MSKIVLHPIAMITPTEKCIYAPSKLQPLKKVSLAEFTEMYANTSHIVLVSREVDGKSNPQRTAAYTADSQHPDWDGFDGWYIL